ncbi:hypothetical protein LguiA_027235 [Lonicera macranthoides]
MYISRGTGTSRLHTFGISNARNDASACRNAIITLSSMMNGNKMVAEARHLLETTLPEIPKPELPKLPPLPKVELPHLPVFPQPDLPKVPQPELSKLPELPPLPKFPDLPKPTLPKEIPIPSLSHP